MESKKEVAAAKPLRTLNRCPRSPVPRTQESQSLPVPGSSPGAQLARSIAPRSSYRHYILRALQIPPKPAESGALQPWTIHFTEQQLIRPRSPFTTLPRRLTTSRMIHFLTLMTASSASPSECSVPKAILTRLTERLPRHQWLSRLQPVSPVRSAVPSTTSASDSATPALAAHRQTETLCNSRFVD